MWRAVRVLVQQLGLHGYMDQDVPGVGRMIFYLLVVPYQWSVLIKQILCHPENIGISNMTWLKLILEVVILLAHISLKLYLIEILYFLQILIQVPYLECVLKCMLRKYVNTFIVWGHKSWFLWVKIKITKNLIEFWEKMYILVWAILAL